MPRAALWRCDSAQPGAKLSALVRNTAQLPQIDMELPAKRFLGTNTTDCLHSGIVNGSA